MFPTWVRETPSSRCDRAQPHKLPVAPQGQSWGLSLPPPAPPPISIRHKAPEHEALAGRIGGIDSGGETKRPFAPASARGQREVAPPASRGWPVGPRAAARSAVGGSPGCRCRVPPPPALTTPLPLTRRRPTGEWARPAAPGCAGSSSRARGGWRPDTAGTRGDNQGGRAAVRSLGVQAELPREGVQAGDPPQTTTTGMSGTQGDTRNRCPGAGSEGSGMANSR